MASHNSVTSISNDMVDTGAAGLISAAGEGRVDVDMIRRVLEAHRDMTINESCHAEEANMDQPAKWYDNICEAIGWSIEIFVKRIFREKPVLINCPSPTPLEEGGIEEESFTGITSESGDCDNGVEFLLAAAEEGRVDVVRQILKIDRDMIFVGDVMGDTALHMAARSGNYNVVLELIRIARLNGQLERAVGDQNADGDTPLHLAIKNRHPQAAHCIVQSFDPNDSQVSWLYEVDNKDGEYPRQLAREYGYMNLASSMPCQQFQSCTITVDIKMALRRKALKEEAEKEDMITWNNLLRAIELNQEMVVMRVLEEKPSLIQHSDRGRGTVFHAAALGGNIDMIRRLVDYFTTNNPNACSELARLMSITDCNGDNPLFVAIKRRNISAALHLTELAPLAIFQLNNVDLNPLQFAIKKAYQDLLKFMIDQAQVSESIKDRLFSYATEACLAHVAIKAEHLGTLQVLMNSLPFLINSSNPKGWKPLSYAASKGYQDQVSFLLTNFPNSVSIHDKDGSMPIHKAIVGGHINIVKEFIAQCPGTLCDIDQKGRTTLHIATKYRKADILFYLLKQKDVKEILNSRDKEGNTFQDLVNDLRNSSRP